MLTSAVKQAWWSTLELQLELVLELELSCLSTSITGWFSVLDDDNDNDDDDESILLEEGTLESPTCKTIKTNYQELRDTIKTN